MKKVVLFIAMMLLFPELYAATSNNTSVTVKGKIKAAGCTVNAQEPDFSVAMGRYATSNFRASGDVSGRDIPFQITLTRCPLTTQSASVKFEGTSVNGYLALDAVSEGSGVGIALYDATGKLIPLASETSAYAIDPITGFATLHFFARFIALTIPVKPGAVQATATFTLNYS